MCNYKLFICLQYCLIQVDESVIDELLPKSKKRKLEIKNKENLEGNGSGFDQHHNINTSFAHHEVDDESTSTSLLKGLFYNILIIALCILFSSPALLLPQHNVIIHPEYCYEILIVGCLSFGLTQTFDTLLACKLYFKVDSLISLRVFFYLYLIGAIAWIFAYSTTYLVWTILCGYKQPLPLSLGVVFIWYLVQYISLYILFKHELSIRNEFRKKIRAFNFSRLYVIFMDVQFNCVSYLFKILPSRMQWSLGLLLPLLREMNFRMLSRILLKSTCDDDPKESGKMLLIIASNSVYLLYVAIKVSHTATQMTSYLILFIDFMINLYSCKNILRLHRIIGQENEGNLAHKRYIQQHLLKLILVETLEVLVPLAYVITVLIAYYGPNADILGNIGNSQWQYEAIPDIRKLVESLMLMFVIDICSAVIAGLLLWKLCCINVLRKACAAIKEYWAIIAVVVSHFLNYVS